MKKGIDLWLDYETYYSDEYSLNKMIRTKYINDPDFKAHGAAVALNDSASFWVTGDELPLFFADVGPHLDSMCCHNGLFDHGITATHFYDRRVQLRDTMSMARVALSRKFPGQRMSLAKLAQYYFPDNPELWKFEGILANFKGVVNLDPTQEKEMARYAVQDNEVMRQLYYKLLKEDVPWDIVLEDISLTLGMGCYTQLEMDVELAQAINVKETAEKEEAVKTMNITRAQLRSGEQYAELLRAEGIEPPTKLNPKGKVIYAFAAKDLDFMALGEHPDPRVRALFALRVGEKSAQTMTRSAMFATLPRKLPIPLAVAAAHTGRHGGEEYNMQNLEKGTKLRECVRAPKGYKLVVGDLSGIELRINAWWCDEETLLGPWQIDPQYDVYSALGCRIYGRPITKADVDERFNSKTSELACQYGAGEERIMQALKQKKVNCDAAMAKLIKTTYRKTRTRIVARWKWLGDFAIPAMAGIIAPVEMKGVRFELGRAVLPSGRSLYYPGLRVNENGDWVYMFTKGYATFEKKLYGGALLENLIQAMSYDVFMFIMRLIAQYLKMYLAMAVHDEGVFVVLEEKVQWAKEMLHEFYRCKPEWCVGVPTFGEFGVGDTYAEAK